MKKFIVLIFMLFMLISVTSFAHGNLQHLGKINFPTSGSPEAQPYFETGIMLLHSFEYEEARKQFQIAKCIDPNFLLAYWGEAMTYNHPVWGEQDLINARKVLANLPTASKATPKEQRLIKTLLLLYGKGDKKSRDEAYSDALRQLYKTYPDDDEIASFYALAILGTVGTDRDFQIYMQAAGIADEIYSRNPKHPGALHYALHSYDDPIHAPLGLRAARTYAQIAPDASHALHMPSHIFMALGMWDEVIASNKAAWEAGIKANKNNNPNAFTLDDLHAVRWLSYGYLQKRDFKTAYNLTKQVEKIAIAASSPKAKWYYALMRASYISESRNYGTDLKSQDLRGIEISARASDMYANALIALHDSKPNLQKAKTILHELQTLLHHLPKPETNFKDYFTAVTESGITVANIQALELEAEIKKVENATKQAIQLLKKASALEAKTSFGYGPPLPIQPAYELLGEVFFQEKQYTLAYKNFLISLKRNPNRLLAKQGIEKNRLQLEKAGLPLPGKVNLYFNRLMLPEFHQ